MRKHDLWLVILAFALITWGHVAKELAIFMIGVVGFGFWAYLGSLRKDSDKQ